MDLRKKLKTYPLHCWQVVQLDCILKNYINEEIRGQLLNWTHSWHKIIWRRISLTLCHRHIHKVIFKSIRQFFLVKFKYTQKLNLPAMIWLYRAKLSSRPAKQKYRPEQLLNKTLKRPDLVLFFVCEREEVWEIIILKIYIKIYSNKPT